MNQQESTLRNNRGIPADARYVLFIDQAAHMDWDWNNTFLGYFNDTSPWNPPGDPTDPNNGSAGAYAGVNVLLKAAMNLLQQSSASNPYYYSICEMGYFRQFMESNPGVASIAAAAGKNRFLRIVGGGITSPDCLLCAGESFIRNFLVGKLWLAAQFPGTNLAQLRHCWIPDDFGQDPELPVVVQALGMQSIAFSRLPGYAPGVALNPALLNQLLTQGAVDFQWMASDQASSVFTHWMPGGMPGYFQGSGLFNVQSATNQDQIQQYVALAINNFLAWYNIAAYDPTNPVHNSNPPFPGAPSPYLYLPLDEDFMYPIPGSSTGPYLPQYLKSWNSTYKTTGVYAVQASYDDFVALMLAWQTTNKLKTLNYNGTPYWSGNYASQMQMKVLHYDATRMLLAAEVIGLMASGEFLKAGTPPQLESSYWSNVAAAWDTLVPSTHHDYITGTATDGTPKNSTPPDVLHIEQIPRLNAAWNQAQILVTSQSLITLAGSVQPPQGQGILIVNRLGQPFSGLVELASPVPFGVNSILVPENPLLPVQPTAEGGMVFCVSQQGSLSYTVGELSTDKATLPGAAIIEPTTSGSNAYTLRNGNVQVTVSASANWGISSIAGPIPLQPGKFGNDLVFYQDGGNIYQFGNELGATFQVTPVTPIIVGSGLGATVLEQGPVRVRLQTVVSINGINYTREYSLGAGESFLRMTTTGSAPGTQFSGFSVMVQFPFVQAVTSINHGTPCHWTSQQPLNTWAPPIFRPTHNFVLPYAQGVLLPPVYHSDAPAWGFDSNGVLLGCLFRNTPGTDRGAIASDPSTSTHRYALRSTYNFSDPSSGQPLAEAMSFNTPAMACMVSASPTKALPSGGFIAEIVGSNLPGPRGFILAAKPGDITPGTLILRLYQPANQPQTLQVRLGRGKPASVVAVTALEDPISAGAPNIVLTSDGFTIDTTTALNTVQISF